MKRPGNPMDDPPLRLAEVEEARIRAAYARRERGSVYSRFNPGHLFLVQERERRVLALLERLSFRPLDNKKFLEIGCGTGLWLREFIKWGARPQNVAGIDLLPDRVAEARRLCHELVRIDCGNAAKLAFPNASFDLVLQSTVFTSVLDSSMRQQMASEMLRVLKRDGFILWYDYHMNSPYNHDVRGVKKREISLLFPDCLVELRRITLAPLVARLLAPYSWLACCVLERLKIFNSHYLGVIRKS